MKTVIVRDGDDWNVWAMLDEEADDGMKPWHSNNSLIVGVGQSRDAAVADAVREFEAAVERLQQPPEVF